MYSCQAPEPERLWRTVQGKPPKKRSLSAKPSPYPLNPKPLVIAVVGPTASGKTDVAVAIATKFGGEIIIADSRQVYIGMDIGTNKITAHQNAKVRPLHYRGRTSIVVDGVPYHGIDLVEPNESFTVQQWKKYAQNKIQEITRRGKLPIVEGGTGLYVSALLDNLTIPEVPPDPELRTRLEHRIQQQGTQPIVDEILKQDPEAAAFLDVKNPRRVVRAWEVILKTGVPFSQQRSRGHKRYNDLRIGIARPLAELDRRIERRAKQQIAQGLEKEARFLAKRYGWDIPAMSGIGYAEWRPRSGRPTAVGPPIARAVETVLSDIIRHTKQYARAQIKWLRRDQNIHWVRTPKEAALLVVKNLPLRETSRKDGVAQP